MPTLSTLHSPAPALPSDHGNELSAGRDNGSAHASDGFGKALGHARGSAPQDDAATSAHASAHPAHPHDKDKDGSLSKEKKPDSDDKSAHDMPAGSLLPFVPGLELRPVVAAASGKSLPVKLASGTSVASGTNANGHNKDGIKSLLSHLEDAASQNPSKKAGIAGHASGSASADSLIALQGLDDVAAQTRGGGKKDASTVAIDAGHAALNALNLQSASPPAQPSVAHQLQIPAPPTSPDFTQSLSQHVAWLGAQDIKQAVIHLHPRDLGSINVNVQVHHDKVDVSFAVQHPATVHALQQTLPQLDTLLAQQGLNLGQAQVGQQHNPQQQASHGNGGNGGNGNSAHADAGTDAAMDAPLPARQLAIGLVDDFA